MAQTVREDFYLDRRNGISVDFRSAVRFQPDPTRKFRLAQAVTQNISLKGMQLLSPVILEQKKKFEVWIPLDGTTILPAVARTQWMAVEDTLGDSPYWVRAGLSLAFQNDGHRRLFAQAVLKRVDLGPIRKEQEASKVGVVF